MRRVSLLLVVSAALVGCKSGTNNVVDPFVGRTTIEPPRTGWIQGQPAADPYYPSPPQTAIQPQAASQTAAAPAAAPSEGWVSTAGGHAAPAERSSIFEANRSAVRIPPPSVSAGTSGRYPDVSVAGPAPSVVRPPTTVAHNASATPAAAIPSAVAAAPSPTAGEGIIRIIEPRGGVAATAPLAAGEPRPIDPVSAAGARPIGTTAPAQVVPATAQGSIDIVDLPQTRGGAPQGRSTSTTDTSAIRLVSATSEVAKATAFAPRNRYGYDPQYRWLRGKLEYSQIDRRWKLRYIPIDGKTDQYGGSVVLSDATLLSGCERGDFVEIQGKIGQTSKDDKNFSPVYEVAAIKQAGSN